MTNYVIMTPLGTWRDTLVCHANQLLPVPVSLPVHLAATLMVNPATAYRMISDFVELKEGVVIICVYVCMLLLFVCMCVIICVCVCCYYLC